MKTKQTGTGGSAAARNQKVTLPETTSVRSLVDIFKTEAGGFSLAVELKVKLPGFEKSAAQKLVEEAHQICPYSNATRNNIEVKLTVE
ncbi:hypothetical protein HK102_000978 [Quaeritorhiza haematococci]|nr:hypothetical protein HK102_000978 [Quaeritorhiza haematococci]